MTVKFEPAKVPSVPPREYRTKYQNLAVGDRIRVRESAADRLIERGVSAPNAIAFSSLLDDSGQSIHPGLEGVITDITKYGSGDLVNATFDNGARIRNGISERWFDRIGFHICAQCDRELFEEPDEIDYLCADCRK